MENYFILTYWDIYLWSVFFFFFLLQYVIICYSGITDLMLYVIHVLLLFKNVYIFILLIVTLMK